MRSGGHFAAVPYVNAAWPYREAGVAGCFAPPAGGSLLEAPLGLMDVRLFLKTKKAPSLERDETILALPP